MLLGHQTVMEPHYLIRIFKGRGVIIAYDCAGYGVMSFWLAFILTFPRDNRNKWLWGMGGLFLLWLINVFRITLFMISINQGWKFPLGIDHHTWFNIFSYFFIFLLIYFYEFDILSMKETPQRV